MPNTTVVMRECGEPTADYCHRLLCEIFSPECVFRISEKPFSLALKKSLELGISESREFTLCIDADVIPIAEDLLGMVAEMEQSPKHIPEMQGMIFDNLFRVQRPAGNHLYRTSLADKAIRHIPVEGTSLRPESDMLSSLTRTGNPWKQSQFLVGYHDFGQRYEDVYRKAFLHGQKHAEFSEYLRALWMSLSEDNFEFEVALVALVDSKKFRGVVHVDKSFLEEETKRRLLELGVLDLTPKPQDLDLLSITHMNAKLDPDLLRARDDCEKNLYDKIFYSNSARIRRLLSQRIFQPFFV